jgi:hypothetical protein
MPTDEQGTATGFPRPTGGTPSLGPNRSGVGYLPRPPQGRMIVGVHVATLVVFATLLRTGPR